MATKKRVPVRKDSPEFGDRISETWKIPTVRAERFTRVSPEFRGEKTGGDWVAYPSVRKGFAALDLPDGVHQRVRNELRRKGVAEINGYELRLRVPTYSAPYEKYPGAAAARKAGREQAKEFEKK